MELNNVLTASDVRICVTVKPLGFYYWKNTVLLPAVLIQLKKLNNQNITFVDWLEKPWSISINQMYS